MSAIPSFDHNHVLPPHLGNPTKNNELSPYPCTILDMCHRFATSKERIDILFGFINFRIRMVNHGIIHGFQWVDGSFIENVEVSQKRPPSDIDVVTFFGNLTMEYMEELRQTFPEFSDSNFSKKYYKVDHYPVDITYSPILTVESTRYWIQLFTHNRNSIWKGIIRLPINTLDEDQEALTYLNTLTI